VPVFLITLLVACQSTPEEPLPDDSGTPIDETPATELVCNDGLDDDLDDATDCDDPDCDLVVAAEGACVNEADLALYASFDANAEWNKCVPGDPYGQGCGVDEDCNTQCVHDNTDISLDCSRCFAELVTCLVGSCAVLCAEQPPTDECFECISTNCAPGYSECFGTLVCEYEVGCRDTVDNDGDGLVDADDPDCQ
jgi:hypothetical protein